MRGTASGRGRAVAARPHRRAGEGPEPARGVWRAGRPDAPPLLLWCGAAVVGQHLQDRDEVLVLGAVRIRIVKVDDAAGRGRADELGSDAEVLVARVDERDAL